MTKYGFLARIVAKPEKSEEVAAFLASALQLAQAEPGTVTWYAFRISKTEFGIFDTFPDEASRKAHIEGPIAKALMGKADELLSQPPTIERIDLLARK